MMSTRRSGRQRSRGPRGGGRRGKSLIIYGAVFFAIGLVITIGTYTAADSGGGGTYIISWGPMLGGLVAMIRGTFHLVRDRRAMAQYSQYSSPGVPGGGYGVPAPGYPAPGFAPPGQGGFGAPAFGAPGYGQPGSGAPAQGFAVPASTGTPSPGFTAAPGFTPQPSPGIPGPGWFADPQDPTMLRWWDGQAWTAQTQPTAASFPASPAN